MKNLIKKILTSIIEIESRVILKKYHPFIIAITGSVGKTSTKDAIYTVLTKNPSNSLYIRKSEKSYNSEIGVPLTILGCNNAWSNPFLWLKNIFYGFELIFLKAKYPDCLVIEIGADHPGDIKRITKWLKPDTVVVTKISEVPVHVEFFPSRGHLVKEKGYLVEALKSNGTLIIPHGDEEMKKLLIGVPHKFMTYGVDASSTVSASHDTIIYEEKEGIKKPVGMAFKLNYEGNSLPIIQKGCLGMQQIYPLIAAAAVGISRKIVLTEVSQALLAHEPARGRMNIIDGIKSTTVIDDTYNSSPDALYEALKTLERIETQGRKIAVLGDMMELGKYSIEEHKKAGEYANRVVDILVTVGQRSKVMGNNIISFNTSGEASEYVRGIVEKGDTILVKGSQSIRMERVVKGLMAEPEKAGELLVRQESEWLAKK